MNTGENITKVIRSFYAELQTINRQEVDPCMPALRCRGFDSYLDEFFSLYHTAYQMMSKIFSSEQIWGAFFLTAVFHGSSWCF